MVFEQVLECWSVQIKSEHRALVIVPGQFRSLMWFSFFHFTIVLTGSDFQFHTLALRMTFKTASVCSMGTFSLCLYLPFKCVKWSDVNDSFWTLPQITSRISYFNFLPAVTTWVITPYFLHTRFLGLHFLVKQYFCVSVEEQIVLVKSSWGFFV